jgi:deltex-like protein
MRPILQRTSEIMPLQSSDLYQTECRVSSKKLEDLVVIVTANEIPLDKDGAYAQCSICMEELWRLKYQQDFSSQPDGVGHLPVKPKACADHYFHLDCLKEWLKTSVTCPLCRTQLVQITGYQPMPSGAAMTVQEELDSLPGHETHSTLAVHFAIPSGVQDLDFPLPGERFESFKFVTYLPNNSEGQNVLRMLGLAWNRRLLFRIGYNQVSKRLDKIVLNGLELKTNRVGGVTGNGFPDVSYMSRLKSDLREIGIQ